MALRARGEDTGEGGRKGVGKKKKREQDEEKGAGQKTRE